MARHLPAPAAPERRAWTPALLPSGRLRPLARLLDLRRGSTADPAEPWEIPLRGFDPAWRQGHPSRPSSRAELPPAALDALEGACGPLSLERLLLLPRTTRLVRARRCVLTPTEVLAFGDATVALWIDDGAQGRVLAVAVDEIAAIVDRRVLLYGRLALITAERRLVVRYNTVARPWLHDSLRALRATIARRSESTESLVRWFDPRGQRTTATDLPYKWRFILRSETVRADPDAPASVAIGDVARAGAGRRHDPTGVALLTPDELVIAVEPESELRWASYGVDLVTVARHRLAGLAWDGRVLQVCLAAAADAAAAGVGGDTGASIELRLDPWLVGAMQAAFGEAVRWLNPGSVQRGRRV